MSGEPNIIDTNVVVHHFRSKGGFTKQLNAQAVFLPEIVLGELYAGAFHSKRPAHQQKKIEDFLPSVEILLTDFITSHFYGKIWAQLRGDGKTLPQNDIWIAALGMQHQRPIVTSDIHFDYISGIRNFAW